VLVLSVRWWPTPMSVSWLLTYWEESGPDPAWFALLMAEVRKLEVMMRARLLRLSNQGGDWREHMHASQHWPHPIPISALQNYSSLPRYLQVKRFQVTRSILHMHPYRTNFILSFRGRNGHQLDDQCLLYRPSPINQSINPWNLLMIPVYPSAIHIYVTSIQQVWEHRLNP